MPLLPWVLLQVLGSAHVEQFWPQTAVGWITFVVAVFGLLAVLYGYAKALTAINGLGGRVSAVEQKQAEVSGQQVERDKVWALMVQNLQHLTTQIGEAKRSAEECDSNSEHYFIEIGAKIAELGSKVEAADKSAHGRLSAIEAELRLRNQAIPLHIAKQ